MRWTPVYFKAKSARAPQNENKVPIRVVKPISLKNEITYAAKKTTEDKCILEMSLLFKCWRENNFSDAICVKYVDAISHCYKKYMKEAAVQRELRKINVPPPNTTKLTSKQMSYLLRMYPTV